MKRKANLSESLLLANEAMMEAEEIRTLADSFKSVQAKGAMHRVADSYDIMAASYLHIHAMNLHKH